MQQVQLKHKHEREIYQSDGHSTGAIKVQDRERQKERDLMVIKQVELKYRLEKYISHGQATCAIEVQTRERYLIVTQRVHLNYRLERDI